MSSSEKKTYGRFEVIRQIGEGAMAVVYQARDPLLHRDVAIKVLHSGLLDDVEAGRRFDREARSLAQLKHPGIIKIIDVGVEDNQTYLVVEYLPNGTLKQQLGSPFPHQRAAALLVPIAQALAHAHQSGIVHRDVKPSNILLADDGAPKLADFGIVRITNREETNNLTATGTSLGSPDYMAPEQVLGKVVDHRADIYALGVIFFEMVTGHKPFEAETPFAVMMKQANEPLPHPGGLVTGLPKSVVKTLFKALAKQPEDRFASMSTFADALDKIAQGARDLPIQLRRQQPRLKKPVILMAAGVLTVLLLIGAAVLLTQPAVGGRQPTVVAAGLGVDKAQTPDRPMPTPTTSPTLTASSTSTATANATVTPTLTPTATPFRPVTDGTGVPAPVSAIQPENISQIKELARWGTSYISDIAISPDQKLVASATSRGVYINDAESGEVIRFIESGAWVRRVTFSPDGTHIAVWTMENSLLVWNVTDSAVKQSVKLAGDAEEDFFCFNGEIFYKYENVCPFLRGPGIEFSPSGKTLAIGSNQGKIIIWSLAEQKATLTLEGLEGWVREIAFSPYGDALVAGGENGTIRLWSTKDGSILHELKFGLYEVGEVLQVAISSDNQYLAAYASRVESGWNTERGVICIWDVTTGSVVKCVTSIAMLPTGFAFSPDNAYLLTSDQIDRSLSTGTRALQVAAVKGSGIQSYSSPAIRTFNFHQHESNFLTADYKGVIKRWSYNNGQIKEIGVVTLDLPSAAVEKLILSVDGKTLVSFVPLRIWEVKQGTLTAEFPEKGHVTTAGFADEGNGLIVISDNGGLEKINLQDFSKSKLLNSNYGGMYEVSPDGLLLLSGEYGFNLTRSTDGLRLTNWRDRYGIGLFSIESQPLAVIEEYKTTSIRLTRIDNNQEIDDIVLPGEVFWNLVNHHREENGVRHSYSNPHIDGAVSKDLNFIAILYQDGQLFLWDRKLTEDDTVAKNDNYQILQTGQETVEYDSYRSEYHRAASHVLAFSNDSQLLAVGGRNGEIQIWDTATGKKISTIEGHQGPVWSLVFSEDSAYLVSGSEDGTIRFWGVTSPP